MEISHYETTERIPELGKINQVILKPGCDEIQATKTDSGHWQQLKTRLQ